MTYAEFAARAGEATRDFDQFVSGAGIAGEIVADHIGYKCGSTAEFEKMRAAMETVSDFVYQSIISKRRIAVIKFTSPLQTICGPIAYLELSDQKPDGSQRSGFDHIEFFPKSRTPEKMAEFLRGKGVVVQKADRPHHVTYDFTLPSGFKVRIEPEPLMAKIVREEIR